MDDRLRPEGLQRLRDEALVGEVAADETAGEDRPFMAGGEVVVDDKVVARFTQGPYDMAANIAGAAGDKNFHGRTFYPIPPEKARDNTTG